MRVVIGQGKPLSVDLGTLDHVYIQPGGLGPGLRSAFTYMVANAESEFFGVQAKVDVNGRVRQFAVVLTEGDVRAILKRTVGSMSPEDLRAWLTD